MALGAVAIDETLWRADIGRALNVCAGLVDGALILIAAVHRCSRLLALARIACLTLWAIAVNHALKAG